MRKKHKRLSVTDVEQALNVFNVSGKVEMHELQRYLTTLGERLSESEMRAFMDIAQVDEDGHVDCARLARALMS